MLRPTITRLVTSVALICASLAWSGWVFLHSVGDPHRAERIAHAILDNPDARAEIAAPLADQIVENLALPESTKATIRTTVADVLGDPNIVGNFIAAFGSAQANALGVDDERPTTINAGALINEVRDRLSALGYQDIAAQIPTSTASIDLPKVHSPVISRIRSLASTWTMYLAITAIVLLVGLIVFGDRRRVLRSYGFWAIFTGAFWAIGPRLAPWFAHQSAPEADALVGATVDAVAGPITTWATVLVISGVIALVVRYTVLAERSQLDKYAPMADAPVGPPAMLQPVLAGHASPTYGYGMTRTDQVPIQQPSPGYAMPTGGQYAATAAQPAFAQTGVVAETPRPGNAVPLLIRPLDLPTSSEILFPLNLPNQPHSPSEPNDAR